MKNKLIPGFEQNAPHKLDNTLNKKDAATEQVDGGFLFAGTPATGTNANGGRHD